MRKLMISLLLVLLLSITGATFAQDVIFCGELAPEDCDILQASADAMAEVSSASFDFSFDIDATDLGEGTPDLDITLGGDGAYNLDGALLDSLMGAEGEGAFTAVMGLLRGFQGDLALDLTLPEELGMEIGLPITDLSLELLLVDGVGYLNFATLAPILGDPEALGLPAGWGGIDIAGLIEMLVESDPTMMDVFSEGFSQGFDSGMAMGNMTNIEGMSISRAADEGGNAVFVSSVDFATLIQDPTFADLVRAQMAAQGQDMSAEEFDQVIELLGMMGEDFVIEVTSKINLETNFQTAVGVNVQLDLASVMAMAGETAAAPMVSMTGTFNLSDHNAAPAITAPADADIAPPEMLLGMAGGF